MKQITIGTRGSKLAMIQTHWVVERLRQHWPTLEITIEQITTRGDHNQDMPLSQLGGDGVFVTEIERALQEQRIDLAVHSLKDLPTAQPDGLHLMAACLREDVRDVLIFQSPTMLPLPEYRGDQSYSASEHPSVFAPPRIVTDGPGGYLSAAASPDALPHALLKAQSSAPLRVGTCSLRRTAQVRALFPNASILPLRGNVDTRLRKLDAGDYDCIVLASAGLHRMGLHNRLADRLLYLSVNAMMPAPGQGALALEMRDEPEMRRLVAPLSDLAVQAATSAERMFMRHLGAGCYLPVAAYGELLDQELSLRGLVISLDGQRQVRVQQRMHWTPETNIEQAEQLGVMLAEEALAQGANQIIEALDSARPFEPQEHHHV